MLVAVGLSECSADSCRDRCYGHAGDGCFLYGRYQSVKMDAMASQFGVSVDFLDKELAGFIANGR